MLETIDRSRLNGHDAVDLARVRYRQLCSVQAAFFADLVEAGRCPPGEDATAPVLRYGGFDIFAPDILAMAMAMAMALALALAWTTRAAEYQLFLASDVVERLPRCTGDDRRPRRCAEGEGPHRRGQRPGRAVAGTSQEPGEIPAGAR